MRLILAIILPPVCFLLIGKPIAALVSLILMVMLWGWPVASLWAIYSLGQYKTDQKIAAVTSKDRS